LAILLVVVLYKCLEGSMKTRLILLLRAFRWGWWGFRMRCAHEIEQGVYAVFGIVALLMQAVIHLGVFAA